MGAGADAMHRPVSHPRFELPAPAPGVEEVLQIEQILWTSDGPLCSDEVLHGDEGDGLAMKVPDDTVFPSFREIQPGRHRGNQIDPEGRSHLKEGVWINEVPRRVTNKRRTKTGERMIDLLRVLRCRVNPQINVFGHARFGVFHHRITADHQESDLTLEEHV